LPSPEHPIHMPDAGSRLDDLLARLNDLRGQVGGALQNAVNEARQRAEELRSRLPSPDHPIHVPDWRDGLAAIKARLDDVVGKVTGAAEQKLADLRAKLEDFRQHLPGPEHPIELPAFGSRLDWVKARLSELRQQLPGAVHGAVDELRAKLQALRERTCGAEHPIHLPSLVEQIRGTLETVKGQVGDAARGQIDQLVTRFQEARTQFFNNVEHARQQLEHLRAGAEISPRTRMLIDQVRDKLGELRPGHH